MPLLFLNTDHSSSRVLFDIKDIYPTITKDLLTKCLKFYEEKFQISDDDKKYICKKFFTILWRRYVDKEDGLFDVTMGTYDGIEVWELAGAFLLRKISEKIW